MTKSMVIAGQLSAGISPWVSVRLPASASMASATPSNTLGAAICSLASASIRFDSAAFNWLSESIRKLADTTTRSPASTR